MIPGSDRSLTPAVTPVVWTVKGMTGEAHTCQVLLLLLTRLQGVLRRAKPYTVIALIPHWQKIFTSPVL